jgi:hypothetical protein
LTKSVKRNISLINSPVNKDITNKSLFHHSIIPTFQLGRSPKVPSITHSNTLSVTNPAQIQALDFDFLPHNIHGNLLNLLKNISNEGLTPFPVVFLPFFRLTLKHPFYILPPPKMGISLKKKEVLR